MDLVDSLVKNNWLKTPGIIRAFKKIKRKDFMPQDIKVLSEVDEPMPIGKGQTISQPLTVAFMMEKLSPKKGDKILDVGSGSGWTTAILASIVGSKGRVIAMEIIPELKEFGEGNVSKYGFIEKGTVKFILGDGSRGYKEEAPYDRILVSAAAKKMPAHLKKQLKTGGKMVVPVGNSIIVVVKKTESEFEEKEYEGFSFVPLV